MNAAINTLTTTLRVGTRDRAAATYARLLERSGFVSRVQHLAETVWVSPKVCGLADSGAGL